VSANKAAGGLSHPDCNIANGVAAERFSWRTRPEMRLQAAFIEARPFEDQTGTHDMTSTKPHPEKAARSTPGGFSSPQLAVIQKEGIEKLVDMESGLVQKLQQANQKWFSRAEAEANLASEFLTNLTSARSLPETTSAFQQWTTGRMELAAEDVRHFLADTQELVAAGAHLWSANWLLDKRGATGKRAA
jgi:hypothetical protein